MLLSWLSYTSVATLNDQSAAAQAVLVRAHDYSCVANGQVFVARSWLSDELLKALRADVRDLLSDADGSVKDMSEPIGERLKLELFTQHWSVPGESEPSEARRAARRLIDELRQELETVMGRQLTIDEMGAQAKYTIGKVGQPVCVSSNDPPASASVSPLSMRKRSLMAHALKLSFRLACDVSPADPYAYRHAPRGALRGGVRSQRSLDHAT